MSANQAQADFHRRFLPDDESDDRRSAAHHKIAPTGMQAPAFLLVQFDIGCGLEAAGTGFDGMPRAGAGIDEIEQIKGGGSAGGGE